MLRSVCCCSVEPPEGSLGEAGSALAQHNGGVAFTLHQRLGSSAIIKNNFDSHAHCHAKMINNMLNDNISKKKIFILF